MEEDINIIIRSMCQDLYENLRHNNSALSKLKSKKYLSNIRNLNIKTEYKYAEDIRDELGILYKNYVIFCRKQEYENNTNIISDIKKSYIELSNIVEQCLLGNIEKISYPKYKKIEHYIQELEATYGGQTEKYIKKLSKRNIGSQKKEIARIYKDKSKIISVKKKEVISILRNKLYDWSNGFKREKDIKIVYNSQKAEYIFMRKNSGKCIRKKRYKFKTKFSDIELLQKNAIKNLKKMNFGISIYEELSADEECFKYIDPFILMIFIEEGYLDYAKIYLRKMNGESRNRKDNLPFKIVYNIDENLKNGVLTPTRNEIISIIAERSSLSVAEIRRVKKINTKELKIG